MPPCLPSSHCLTLTAAWFDTASALICLPAQLCAYRSAGYGRTERVCFGRAARWPYLHPEMEHAHATLHVFLPLPDSDRGVVWHLKGVYMPLDCSHRPKLCSRARGMPARPAVKLHVRGDGGAGAPHSLIYRTPVPSSVWWPRLVAWKVFPLSISLSSVWKFFGCLLGVRAGRGRTATHSYSTSKT